jgi:cytoskeletal protein CcmA (bactofilin family)
MFRDLRKRGESVPPAHEEPMTMTTTQRDAAVQGTAREELNALLGKGSEFEGKLRFEGMVRIDGTFAGQITTSDTLVIGEGARVSAEISCGSLVVRGEVVGNVRASTAVELHQPARLKGDITSPSLMIEKGVVFQGTSKMEELEKDLPRYEASPKASQRNGPQLAAEVATS